MPPNTVYLGVSLFRPWAKPASSTTRDTAAAQLHWQCRIAASAEFGTLRKLC
jgi:hypothetical protein